MGWPRGQMYLDPSLTVYMKINAQVMAFQNVQSKTIKRLESNVARPLHGLGMHKDP